MNSNAINDIVNNNKSNENNIVTSKIMTSEIDEKINNENNFYGTANDNIFENTSLDKGKKEEDRTVVMDSSDTLAMDTDINENINMNKNINENINEKDNENIKFTNSPETQLLLMNDENTIVESSDHEEKQIE
ncbi:hypothetical protein PIROE2DRAFT_65406, partial [Piromyces sp. E2]